MKSRVNQDAGRRLILRLLMMTLAGLAMELRSEPVRRGGLVLQFDDGWSSWRTLIAPELARVNGRASVFVNNQHIHSGRISLEDLQVLQNDFGWEIGTHTYNHYNAIRHVQKQGLQAWMDTQLERSLSELRGAGLNVRNLVFPFNAFSPEITRAVLNHGIDSYRRADPLALATARRADGSLPGSSIDLTRHVPLALLKQWVDLAHARGQLLFLYGHRVLPDAAFVIGRVDEVHAHELVVDAAVVLPQDEDVVLVPDLDRRGTADSIGGLAVSADSRRILTPETSPDLTRLAASGSTFLIGPAYGTRLSDFVSLIDYAAERLTFYTVADIVAGRHQVTETTSDAPAAVGQTGSVP